MFSKMDYSIMDYVLADPSFGIRTPAAWNRLLLAYRRGHFFLYRGRPGQRPL